MDISIIVPVYDVEQYLHRCLDSLLNQECTVSYEIICVNDASPDGSGDILARYVQEYPDIVHVVTNEVNAGLGVSRNRGTKHAQGEYVMFVDSDDFVKKDYLQNYFDVMMDDPCDVLIGGYVLTDGKRGTDHLLPHTEWTQLNFSSAWAKLFRKNFLVDNDLWFSPIRYAEDTYLALCMYARDAKVRYIDYAGYYYYVNPASITRSKPYEKNYEVMLSDLYRSFLDRCDISELSERKRRVIEYSYISDMLNTLVVYNRGCGRQLMDQKVEFFLDDLQSLFPDYKNNPYIGLFKPQGQRTKIRLGMGAFMLANKVGMAKRFLMLFA